MAKLIDLIVSGKSSFANDINAKNIYADNFIKNGSSDNYVLLGGGGHKALSDFSMSHSHPYLSYSSVYPTNTINLNDYFSTSTMYRVYYDYSGSSKIQNGPYESDAGAVINFPTYSGTQVYFNYYNNDVKVRTHYNGHITSWATFITSENIGSQSVNYSASAGNADTLDSFHSNRFTFVYNSTNYNNSSSLTVNQMAADGNSNSHVGMIYAGTDNPVSSSGNWVHVWSQSWSRGSISSWCSQIALGVQQGTGMWYRTTSGALAGKAWNRVLDSANYTSYVNNYYWANVKISTSSNSATYPTFGSLAVINDSCNNSNNSLAYFQHRSNNDWTVKIDSGSYDYGLHINGSQTGTNALSVTGASRFTNTIRIGNGSTALDGNYCEGIRIRAADNTWATIILGATADTGTNTYAWSIHRTSGNNFSISRNSSDGANGLLIDTSGRVGIGTTTPSERLSVNGWVGTIGNTGWYNESYSGGWYMTDSTWVRSYNGKGVVAGGFYHSSYGSTNYVLTSNGGVWAVHTGRNNEANKIIRTDGNGYIQAGWINTTSGDMGTTAATRVYCSDDGYIRYKSLNNFSSDVASKLYWANVSVSTSSSTATYPTFGNLAVINDSSNSGYDALAYFRNHADYDWAVIISANNYGLDIRKNSGGSYSLRNAGNSRLIGSTIVGADASPSYTLDVRGSERIYSTYPQLRIENSAGGTNETSMYISNGTAGWAIGVNPWGIGGGVFGIGQYSGTGSSTWRFKIDNNGYCYTQSYLNLGAGNEKNASNPPYVWGVNGSDNYLRTYATSSLRVSYASSAGDADKLDGEHGSRYTRALGSPNYITINVGGNADTYYPVVISNVSDYYPMQLVNISRAYHETAPDTWNTSTHKGGLTCTLLWNGSSYWDGNSSGAACYCVYKNETYSTMVGGLGNAVGGKVVWLRGGGAVYHIHSMNGTSTTATVYTSTYTDAASRSFAPKTSPEGISVRWPGYAEGADYASSAGNADTVDGQHFNWNNNKNDHTYLWAASSNGQAYLVHRASMSVNYANSAGNADTVDGLHSNRFTFVYNSANYNDNSSLTVNQMAADGNSNSHVGMIYSGTDNPVSSSGNWVHVWSQTWARGTISSWCSQIALGVQQGTGMWYRTTSGALAGRAWNRVLDSANYTSYVNNYYWANVKISTSSNSATYPTFANMKSTGRVYLDEWIQFSGSTGLYWPNTNGAHLYANTTTSYAALIIQGSRGGYCGLQCGPATTYMTVMSTDTHHGLYCENTGTWEFYYNRGNGGVGIRTSSITKNFNVSGQSYLSSNVWIGTTSGGEMLNVGGGIKTENYITFGAYGARFDSDIRNSWRTNIYGNTTNESRLKTVRTDANINNFSEIYGSGLTWATGDTQGYLGVSYSSGKAWIGGGSGNVLHWSTYLVTGNNIGSQSVSYASSSPAAANYGGQGETTKIKIKINSATSWMLSFVVTIYQGYRSSKVMVSGYNYGSNYWYNPEAVLLGDSDGATSIPVYFGYDSAYNLWVGFDGGSYTGVSVSDVTNGYTQISSYKDLFTISNVSSLSTLQTTVTAVNSVNYAVSAGNAHTVDSLHASSFMRATSNGSYYGIQHPDGGTSDWTRTTSSGIIPYTSGGASSLGTSSWPFSTVYANNFYGYLNGNISGNAATVTVNSSDANSTYRMVWHSGNTLYGTGGIYCNPSTDALYASAFYETSDVRLKQNIKHVLTSNDIPQIKEFDWKNSGKHSYGLIAQELESMGYSELVDTKDDGYKSVNYTAALCLIIGKLQLKIKELEDKIKSSSI